MRWLTVVGLALALPPDSSWAQVILSEFLADNALGLKDEDGDREDWIELHNPTAAAVDLSAWSLTDDAGDPRRWEFPAVTLGPGGFLVVHASGKNRRDPARPLHTNFRLSPNGEYLGLLRPDGRVAFEYAPAYPPQVADVSYGVSASTTSFPLLPARATGRLWVPTDDQLGTNWIRAEFDDASWRAVTAGLGWDTSTSPAPGPLAPFLGTDIAAELRGHNATAYARFPFVITNVAELAGLELRLRYDDGFAAFLNGAPVLQRNAPIPADGGVLADSVADWAKAGDQGMRRWYFGFYDASADPDGVYDPITDFDNTDPQWSWDGGSWTRGPGDPPWTTIGRETWHPNGNSGGLNVQWAIRRWISTTAGTVKVLLHGAKENTGCGNGVTFRVLVNGQPRFTRAIAATDAAGFTTTLELTDLDVDDLLDFALDPTGPDGDTQDGCDGSTFAAQILQEAQSGLTWSSAALRPRSATDSPQVEVFDLSRARDRLWVGTNILAFQVLNASADDADLLLAPELVGTVRALGEAAGRYFPEPTPGALGNGGSANLGPLVESVEASPDPPADADDLVITAVVRPTLRAVNSVVLRYRVQFAAEQVTAMLDDGQHQDGAARDGRWGVILPATAASAGQMLRWAVVATDVEGASLRSPAYADPKRSPQYYGTVVQDPALTESRLPVLQWFVQTPTAADSDTGTRGAVFFDGEFYDNVGANLHGQSTRGFPKHSYDFDFNPGHKFRWQTGQPRVDDLNLLTTWADKSHLRNVLAYETYARAGAPAHFAIPVRVQLNGRFHSVANLVENGDDNFLDRLGLDPQGALYKMYNTADRTTDVEKKTRKFEGTEDLADLIAAIGRGTTLARQAALFDRLDLPEIVNFLAARAITADTDCCHKNYYLYRDTRGSGEWLAFPWDVDLSFGRVWTCNNPCLAYYDETIYTNTGLFVGENNTVLAPVLSTPATRAMYLRRVRTLAERLTQAPNIAASNDQWLARSTELRDRIGPDAARDLAKWGTWGRRETITQAVDRLHQQFLPGRRRYLFGADGKSGPLPAPQPANAELRFGPLEIQPTSGQPLQEFLTLTNANTYAVDISDWELEGSVRFRFKPGTVLPARSLAYVSPDRRQFRSRPVSPRGGERLLVLGDYRGELSARGGELRLRDDRGRPVAATNYAGSPSLAQKFLRLTEIMTGLEDGAGTTAFVELTNTGTDPLPLAGVRFTEGITFDFASSAVTSLAAGQHVVLVEDPVAFRLRYGSAPLIAGTFAGHLARGGERLQIVDALGEVILDFSYSPDAEPATEGLGFSLVIRDELGPAWIGLSPTAWRTSASPGGSPGVTDPEAARPVVVINELLTHTDPPQRDAVELYNPADTAVDLSHWWLSDDRKQPRKFSIPRGTILPAHGFVVFDERDFNSPTNAPTGFSFSSHGDEAALFGADAAGNLTGFADYVEFPAAQNGVSFGRHTNSAGKVSFPPQIAVTLGEPNSGPRVGPVVISEILYAPLRGEMAFVELHNSSADIVPLFDPAAPTNTWRLDGVDFEFPRGLSLPPGGTLVVAGGDPMTFRTQHVVAAGTPVLGPWRGTLQRDGERLRLLRPDAPDLLPDGSWRVPWITVDEVRYDDDGPWPVLAGFQLANPSATVAETAMQSWSIERQSPTSWGDDPSHWRASSGPPTPGILPASDANQPPSVSAGVDQEWESDRFPFSVSLAGEAGDDGRPTNPGRLTLAWSLIDGPGRVEFFPVDQARTEIRLPVPGLYRLRLTAFDGVLGASSEVRVTVGRPRWVGTLIETGAAWRYLDTGSAPPQGWVEASFDDSSWSEGLAQLGYGDGDERTTLRATVGDAKLLAAYFRRRFEVVNPAAIQALGLRLLRDDGAIVYLNGREVWRSGMAPGLVTYATPANGTISGAEESVFLTRVIDPSRLRPGLNQLAVEVHQVGASSSDLSFDLELASITDFAAWSANYFRGSEAEPIELSGPAADPDGDGQSNFAEFVAGTHPREAASVLRLRAFRTANGPLELRFPGVAGRSYEVQWRSLETSAGSDWHAVQALGPLTADGESVVLDGEARAAGRARLYRVEVSWAPLP